jgi:hypothetical protein
MLVVNSRGQIAHITEQLASMLGRSRQQMLATSGLHAVEQLMARPFAQMHREYLMVCHRP